MIAADTSSLIAWIRNDIGADTKRLITALGAGIVVLPPVVLTELLSDPTISEAIGPTVSELPTLPIADGHWLRAGRMRSALKAIGIKAKIERVLIAQSCIDHDVALITRDTDFRHFAAHCGLKLA